MDFIELARHRFSARSFLNKPVEKEKLEYVLNAARVAPSAVNKQPYHIYIICENPLRKEINETYNREWFKQAPVVIAVFTDAKLSWKHPVNFKDHADIDAAIAIDHMTLAATSIGLATCWVCNFNFEKLKIILKVTDPELNPVALLPIGYTDSEIDEFRHNEKRKRIDDFVTYC